MKKESPKEEFKDALYGSFKALGIDDFSSRLLSALQSEVEEISLGELAETTGYSLSALSTALKAMEERGLVKRFKKPKSRKVYVLMEKDITTLYTELQKKRHEQSLMPALKKIAEIIRKYQGREEFKNELEQLEDFQQQILFIEEESKKYIQALEKGPK
jgi:DNA-binding transcriptional regulator GbsR (MarR family)